MSEADRVKWDARYAEGAYANRSYPSVFLRRQFHRLTPGPALDIACGTGRNAIYLAGHGYGVDAIDISPVGLARAAHEAATAGLEISWLCQDLLSCPTLPRRDYQLIMMFRFVADELLVQLPAYLAPGGVLMVEQHMVWHKPVTGPGSNRFRVEPGTLAAALTGMEVLLSEEGEVREPDGTTAALARLLVRKPDLGSNV